MHQSVSAVNRKRWAGRYRRRSSHLPRCHGSGTTTVVSRKLRMIGRLTGRMTKQFLPFFSLDPAMNFLPMDGHATGASNPSRTRSPSISMMVDRGIRPDNNPLANFAAENQHFRASACLSHVHCFRLLSLPTALRRNLVRMWPHCPRWSAGCPRSATRNTNLVVELSGRPGRRRPTRVPSV